MSALQVLNVFVGLAVFVLYIVVLTKLFQNEGTSDGISGLICGLYAFAWGWVKHKELNITSTMIIWSILIAVCIVLTAIAPLEIPTFLWGLCVPWLRSGFRW